MKRVPSLSTYLIIDNQSPYGYSAKSSYAPIKLGTMLKAVDKIYFADIKKPLYSKETENEHYGFILEENIYSDSVKSLNKLQTGAFLVVTGNTIDHHFDNKYASDVNIIVQISIPNDYNVRYIIKKDKYKYNEKPEIFIKIDDKKIIKALKDNEAVIDTIYCFVGNNLYRQLLLTQKW